MLLQQRRPLHQLGDHPRHDRRMAATPIRETIRGEL
jgi:hypothetical protein